MTVRGIRGTVDVNALRVAGIAICFSLTAKGTEMAAKYIRIRPMLLDIPANHTGAYSAGAYRSTYQTTLLEAVLYKIL